MRRAVGLWQAIMMLLMMSGLVVVVLKYSAISVRHTADTYVREQADLFLNSSIEKALLAIAAHDRSSGCLPSYAPAAVSERGKVYTAQVRMTHYYLLEDSIDYNDCSALRVPIESEESHGMVMMEVEVNATIDGEARVRLLRRTLQRP